MKHRTLAKAGTGLAVGALLTAPLMGIFTLGSLGGIPSVPFTVFEWLIRVLPGRFVIFGLDLTVRVLEGLGFNVKNTAKTAEQVLAVTSLFVAGLIIGLLFFLLIRRAGRRRIKRYGLGVGAVVGIFSVVITLIQGPPATGAGKVGIVIWVLGFFLLWGWGIARLYLVAFPVRRVVAEPTEGTTQSASPAAAVPMPLTPFPPESGAVPIPAKPPISTSLPPKAQPDARSPSRVEMRAREAPVAEAHVISRRRFIIQMGGLIATIVVVGADVGEVLRAQAAPRPPLVVKAPIPFPNANSPVQPVLGTRPEYTAVADHYRIDIDLTPPAVDPNVWRLVINGLVAHPLSLTLDQIKTGYKSVDQFVTLACISNPVGGSLIGTTLWTGIPFREVLAQAAPTATARYAHLVSEDGFDEAIDLTMINSDPRITLTYAWNGQPLTPPHGFPLRVYIPDLYGMKQPKWIMSITLVADPIQGYWVTRGWDQKAEMRTTSVIDTVLTNPLDMRGGVTYVPIGGIAHAGAKGISKVEVQVDSGPWEAAELRAPLSGLTWVIWRYDWPFAEGLHNFSVRTFDGQGQLQVTADNPTFPAGATGIDSKRVDFLPPKL
jgi:DMSO/TMAO reductase YedYZ molybdopterin-dependent catalytic subunit